jgi:hypothetical protein
MSKVCTSIGTKFERTIQDLFPDLRSTVREQNTPDFFHPTLNFWIEAKVGYIGWGARIKDYQIESFREINEPLVYAIGFHDFFQANQRLTQTTELERQDYLDKNMEVLQICFISQELINLLWKKERRISEKEKTPYCMIKSSTLNNIFERREFKRFEETVNPEDYYGFSYSDYDFFVSQINGTLYRSIIKKTDTCLTDFIKEQIS